MRRDPGLPDAGAFRPDVEAVRIMLRAAAVAGETYSYAGLLMALGTRFSRPRMRALCKVLDVIDRDAAANGEPELAVFVVREGDRLPGQGWWVGRQDWGGAWTGGEALRFVTGLQQTATVFWQGREGVLLFQGLGGRMHPCSHRSQDG